LSDIPDPEVQISLSELISSGNRLRRLYRQFVSLCFYPTTSLLSQWFGYRTFACGVGIQLSRWPAFTPALHKGCQSLCRGNQIQIWFSVCFQSRTL